MTMQRLTVGDGYPELVTKINKVINYNILQSNKTWLVTDYGAKCDGVTDDTKAIQSVIDLAATGDTIVFPNSSCVMLGTVYNTKRLNVIGNYCNIILSNNYAAFYFQTADQCVIKEFVFTGSGKTSLKTNQIGLFITGSARHQISDIRFNSMGGTGLMLVNTYGEATNKQLGNNINNITLFSNYQGIAMLNRSEYNILTNITAYENTTAVYDSSGNNTLCGFSFEVNTTGYKMTNGANVGHGAIIGGNFNHHTTYALDFNGNATGMLISGVNFFQGHCYIYGGSKGVHFNNCVFDGIATSGAITFDGATTTGHSVDNCRWFTNSTDPKARITATNSAKFAVRNMRRLDGLVFNFGSLATVAAKTANYTVVSSDTDRTVKGDATAGAITFTLMSAVGMDNSRLTFIKVDASVNTVTIDGSGSETINGALTSVLSTQWQTVTIESDGANWIIVN